MDADLVEAAAALRWARPDLSAELADHVLDEASATGQRERWLAAAGWAVHARAATGDGRETACGVLAGLAHWGSGALAGAAAHRLRIELAMVAAGAGEVEFARRLLAGVQAGDGDPELTADLLCAHARCAVEDAPDEVAAALDSADAAWASVGGTASHLGGASVALVRAVVERRAGRPAAAVDHATDGLARLERARVGSGTPSGHLAAALAAEWISALLDAGRISEARDGCDALLPRLSEQARPTRQLALLRLTVTRALAAQDARADTGQLLAQAADDAAGSDVPDLEAVCRTALGALHEQAGRLDTALEALQLAVGAERRDRDRSRRFLAALAEMPLDPQPEQPKRRRERVDASAGTSGTETAAKAISTDATMLLPAITRGDRKLRANRGEDQERGKSRFERLLEEPSPAETEPAPAEERPAAWDAVPWSSATGESPIGDLLIQSLRSGSAETSGNGSARRNGKSVGAQARRSDEADGSSGWMPSFDADRAGEEQPRARRRSRSADTSRKRSHRARDREERDDPASASSGLAEPARHPDEAPEEQERSGRSRRRARQDDDRTARGRHGRSADLDAGERDEAERDEGGRSRGARSGGGARRRPDEPAAADQWSPGSDEPSSPNGHHSDRHSEAAPAITPASPAGSDDSDGWLQSALAELDRALSGIGVGGPAVVDEPTPSDDGCAVVVDIARDGRRFAGRRAAAVVRSVADMLADRLPAGARSRFADSDALVVTRAGWSRADATAWMHRTLPGLLDGFVAAEELPGAQLRVAVHDVDGPVGAQILQPLTRPGRDREPDDERRGGDTRRDPWADVTTTVAEAHGQKYRAAAQAGLQERGSRGLRGHDAESGGEAAAAGEPPRWPFSGDDEGPARHGADHARPAEPAPGAAGEQSRRHRADSGDRASDRPPAKSSGSGGASRRRRDEKPPSAGSNGNGAANGAGSGAGRAGRRAKRDADAAAAATEQIAAQATVVEGRGGSAGPEPQRSESTEGLGIADLLAGALAAYRGI